jgi:hypothetical protein
MLLFASRPIGKISVIFLVNHIVLKQYLTNSQYFWIFTCVYITTIFVNFLEILVNILSLIFVTWNTYSAMNIQSRESRDENNAKHVDL